MSVSPRARTRRVPLTVPLTGLLLWDWRESYVVLVVLVLPGVLYVRMPVLLPIVLGAVTVAGLGVRIRRISEWWLLLRTGHVVVPDGVVHTTVEAGTTHLAHATGWDVHRGWFTGDIADNVIAYTVDGQSRTLHFRGLPYTSGVILARSDKALCINVFPFDARSSDDRWNISIPRTALMGMPATIALYGGLVMGIVLGAT